MSGKAKRKRAGVEAMQVVALEGRLPRGAGRTGAGMLKAFGRAEVVRAADGAPLVSEVDGKTKIHPKAEKILAGRPFAIRLTAPVLFGARITGPTLARLRRATGFAGFVLAPGRGPSRRRTKKLRCLIQVECRSEKLADRVFAIGIANKAQMCSKKLESRTRVAAWIQVPEANLRAAVRAVETLVKRERQAVEVRMLVSGRLPAGEGVAFPWDGVLGSEMFYLVTIGMDWFNW